MKIAINPIKLIKRISREAFKNADVRSFAFRNKKKYSRKQKHSTGWM